MSRNVFTTFRVLTPDGWLLFGTRSARLFAYGLLAVILFFYLSDVGLRDDQVGLLFTLTLLGDTVISLWITTRADRVGRRRMLVVGALLMAFAGLLFALTSSFLLLLIAATIGVISPSGNEVGPFLSIEQAALAQTVPTPERTHVFAWYNLAGSVATALGSLCGGLIAWLTARLGATGADQYRPVVFAYGAIGLLLAAAFARLSPTAEIQPADIPASVRPGRFGLHRSGKVVLGLAVLFALDAFGGGFVIQSIVSKWFQVRFQLDPAILGSIFFGANLLAGASALSAAWVARRIGLLNTMVLTHLPSNILLILVPFMPTPALAIAVLLARFSISQMDVPTRQSYTVAVVLPEERSAAAGVTGVARSVGASISPYLASACLAQASLLALPFVLGGGIKILYDVLLFWRFSSTRPAEERG